MSDTGRKWWKAALFSILVPGLGQLYNGQARRGILFFLLNKLPWIAILLGVALGISLGPLTLGAIATGIIIFLAALADSISSAGKQRHSFQPRPYNRRRVYLAAAVVYLFLLDPLSGFAMKRFFLEAFHIPSGAMEDTLLVGDYMYADKFIYGLGREVPRPGDVVIFRSPVDPDRDLIKRCVAVGGQVVEVVDKVLYVDGVRFEDPPLAKYADRRTYPATVSPRDNYGPHTVPPDHFFMMGDNRDNSADSRFYGAVPGELVEGKAILLYWSWESGKGVRWDRLYQSIH